LRAPNLALARQEREHITVLVFDGANDGSSEDLRHVFVLGPGTTLIETFSIVRRHRKRAALGGNYGRVAEQLRDSRPVERRGHHQQSQILSHRLLSIETQRQAQVGIQAALVKFIEYHQRNAFQRRVTLQPPSEDAFSDYFDLRVLADFCFQASAIADGATDRLTECLSHASGDSAGRKATRFKHHDATIATPCFTQQRERHAGGLAGTGRGLQNDIAMVGQGASQVGQRGFDGELYCWAVHVGIIIHRAIPFRHDAWLHSAVVKEPREKSMELAHRFFCSLLLACVVGSAGAAELGTARPESVGMSSQRLNLLTTQMKALTASGELPGVVTMVARKGKVVHLEASGKRELENGSPLQKDSIFRIYSMTKPITGVAMMILFEQGKWQLDDPVSRYIPEFANLKVAKLDPATGAVSTVPPNHPMTMRELMSHSGGLSYGVFGDTSVDKQYVEQRVLDPAQPMQAMIDKLSKIPLLFQPGERWHYSVSVDVQGYLVEKLSGQSFPEFLQQHVFRPLKMVDTSFYVTPDKLNRLVEFYFRDKDGKTSKHPNVADYTKPPMLPSGGGGLVSTAGDYMRFCQMLLNGGVLDGQRILSPLTVKLMRTNMLPQRARTISPGTGFGLDFAVVEDSGAAGGYVGEGTYYWGGFAGTWFWIDPVRELIVIGMIQQRGDTMPDLRALSRSLTYQAIVAE
jgi:CubicO group peptidase (beta-lactamase class C family)